MVCVSVCVKVLRKNVCYHDYYVLVSILVCQYTWLIIMKEGLFIYGMFEVLWGKGDWERGRGTSCISHCLMQALTIKLVR
jgi:hypothetical protein